MSKIYLVPTTLGESKLETVLPPDHRNIIVSISHFIVENIRTTRRFLKLVDKDIDIDQLTFFELNKHTKAADLHRYRRTAERRPRYWDYFGSRLSGHRRPRSRYCANCAREKHPCSSAGWPIVDPAFADSFGIERTKLCF